MPKLKKKKKESHTHTTQTSVKQSKNPEGKSTRMVQISR